MASIVQTKTYAFNSASSADVTLDSGTTAGSLIACTSAQQAAAVRTWSWADATNGAYGQDVTLFTSDNRRIQIDSFAGSAASVTVITWTPSATAKVQGVVYEVSGIAASSHVDTTGQHDETSNVNTSYCAASGGITTSGAGLVLAVALSDASTGAWSAKDGSWSLDNSGTGPGWGTQSKLLSSDLSGDRCELTHTGTARSGGGVCASYVAAGGGNPEASGSGAAEASGSGSVAARRAASGTGQADASGSGSSAAIRAAAGAGAAEASGAGGAARVAAASGSGASEASGSGTAARVPAASGSGAATASGSGTAAMHRAATGAGAAEASSAGTAARILSATGAGGATAAGAGTAEIVSAIKQAAGTGGAVASGSGTAAIVRAASGTGGAAASGAGTASGPRVTRDGGGHARRHHPVIIAGARERAERERRRRRLRLQNEALIAVLVGI